MGKKKLPVPPAPPPLASLFPESGRVLLSGGGKQFVERIGLIAIREVILQVMLGENIRDKTEPLSRRRLAQVSGAIVAMFAQGYLSNDKFGSELAARAVAQLRAGPKSDKAVMWPALWVLGLNDKAFQNVLRGDAQGLDRYVTDFETAIRDAAEHCRTQLGEFTLTLGYREGEDGQRVELGWEGIARLTTAIGAQTLTLRGSDKSMYGKLFERLVLGSFLTLLGGKRVDSKRPDKGKGVFWLSDRSEGRESDATLQVEPGKLARFDIGFIGPGNSEMPSDKLTRYRSEIDRGGVTSTVVTFIVVDGLPKKGITEEIAKQIGAEIVKMVEPDWPRRLAKLLQTRVGFQSPLADLPDAEMRDFLKAEIDKIPVQEFLSGVTVQELEPAAPPGEKLDVDLDEEE